MGVGRFSQSYRRVHNLHFWVKKARFVMISTRRVPIVYWAVTTVSPIQMSPVSCVVINLPCIEKKGTFWIQEKHQKLEPYSHVLSLMNLINQQNRATTKINLSLFGYCVKGLKSPEQKAIATIVLWPSQLNNHYHVTHIFFFLCIRPTVKSVHKAVKKKLKANILFPWEALWV